MGDGILKSMIKDNIAKFGCYIMSTGTNKLEHLLARAYDLMLYGNTNVKLRKEIRAHFIVRDWKDGDDLGTHVYHGRARLISEDDAAVVWNEDFYKYASELAPEGYYFGSHPGDGSCIGWFKSEE